MIRNAALSVFGRGGYKKASAGDIAAAAGISKSMVFYYFGSKKSLYLYLVESSVNIIHSEIESVLRPSTTDFLDRIKMAAGIKVSVMKRYPALLTFFTSVYNESDREVAEDIMTLLEGYGQLGSVMALEGADLSRFKDDIDPELLLRFMKWASEGFPGKTGKGTVSLDAFVEDFYKCLEYMKKYFYK